MTVRISSTSQACVICQRTDTELMLVQIIETGSGPGGGLYACVTNCAARVATWHTAPDWLKEELARRRAH